MIVRRRNEVRARRAGEGCFPHGPGRDAAKLQAARRHVHDLKRDAPVSAGRRADAMSDIRAVSPPEQAVELDRPCGELNWVRRPDLEDEGRGLLADGPAGEERRGVAPGVAYVYRTITAEAPSDLLVTLSWPDAMAAWLNGEKIFRFETHIPYFDHDHNVRLSLKKGENHLLIKVVKEFDPNGIRFGSRPIGPNAALRRTVGVIIPGRGCIMSVCAWSARLRKRERTSHESARVSHRRRSGQMSGTRSD